MSENRVGLGNELVGRRRVEIVWERAGLRGTPGGKSDVDHTLSLLQKPADNFSSISLAEGRNVWLERPASVGDFTHLQLSGGFYRRGTPVAVYGLSMMGKLIQSPSKENFAEGNESLVATDWIDRWGQLQIDTRKYTPTGAYQINEALQKARRTFMVEKRLGQLEERSVVVPQALFVYSFPDNLDELGKSMAGICFAVPNPQLIFHHSFNTRLREEVGGSAADDLLKYTRSGAKGLRVVHDRLGQFHGQATLGNISLLERNSQRDVFIKNWHAAQALPNSPEAEMKARSLELIRFNLSSLSIIRTFVEMGKLDSSEAVKIIKYLLAYTLDGYLDVGNPPVSVTVRTSEMDPIIYTLLDNEASLEEKVELYSGLLRNVMEQSGQREGP